MKSVCGPTGRALLGSLLVVSLAAPAYSYQSTGTYAVDYVASASTGLDINEKGDIIGTSYLDIGCGSSCLPPLETVAWRDGLRIVLPAVSFSSHIFPLDINDQGWIVGSAGFPGTASHAVVWKPVGDTYEAIDIGHLPGKTSSYAVGIDELGRVVGWSSTLNFPPSGAPFMWTETGGMVDLSAQGFPVEAPLGISPGGTVATYGYWYDLDVPGVFFTVPAPPSGYLVQSSKVAINDAGDQARFLVSQSGQNLVYPFRLNHEMTWQQISLSGTGHLSTYGLGSINDAKDVTLTVQSTGMIAYGPDGLAQPIAPFVSSAYGGGPITSVGPMTAQGTILAQMIIGQSGQRLVRLVPEEPCVTDCIRVASIAMRGRGPSYCDQGSNRVKAKLTVTSQTGARLPGVAVTGHWLDDYYLDAEVSAQTNANGQVTFMHTGPPCVGAVAFLVTDATVADRTLDRTAGILTSNIIPTPRAGVEVTSFEGGDLSLDDPADAGVPRRFEPRQD